MWGKKEKDCWEQADDISLTHRNKQPFLKEKKKTNQLVFYETKTSEKIPGLNVISLNQYWFTEIASLVSALYQRSEHVTS